MAKISPSILAADFGRLAEEIASAEAAGVDMLHLDIMDGHFVPNISYGPAVVKTVNKLTDLFLDVHLMLSEPERYFEDFIKAGGDAITFHIEVHPDPKPFAQKIRDLGARPGISLNPDKKAGDVIPYLEYFDYLLVMSVFPGFGGQSFIETSLDTIAAARKHIETEGLSTRIIVDGGVDATNSGRVVQAGADILVMGTAFFKAPKRSQLTDLVHKL